MQLGEDRKRAVRRRSPFCPSGVGTSSRSFARSDHPATTALLAPAIGSFPGGPGCRRSARSRILDPLTVMDRKFEEIDHGGDIGLEAWGESTERGLENVTLGLFSLMTRGGAAARVERELAVEAGSDEELLVDWLSEVITAAAAHGEVYCETEIRSSGPHSVHGVVRGEPADPARHEFRFEVKAATYHRLVFEREKTGWHVRVVFDL